MTAAESPQRRLFVAWRNPETRQIIPVGLLLASSQFLRRDERWQDAVISTVAGLVGMVPEGLVLLTSVAFLLAALALEQAGIGRRALEDGAVGRQRTEQRASRQGSHYEPGTSSHTYLTPLRDTQYAALTS